MDKYEYNLSLEQIKKYYREGNCTQAAKIADTIDWRKVKVWSTLAMIINIYEDVGQLEDAKNLCILAYNRKLGGRQLVYKLCELLIALKDIPDAKEVYDEYVKMAPRDLARYTLLYKMNIAKGASNEALIGILLEYLQHDRDENCLMELAKLYEKSGQIQKAMETCDEIILWFNGGEHFEDALKLKKKYGALTHNQKMMLERLDSLRENPYQAKKRNVTIELPKGILNAEDIIKAATGKVDTKAVNNAADMLEVMSLKKDSKPKTVEAKPQVKTEAVKPQPEDNSISKEEPAVKAKKVELPNMEIKKKERPNPILNKFIKKAEKPVQPEKEESVEEKLEKETIIEAAVDEPVKTEPIQEILAEESKAAYEETLEPIEQEKTSESDEQEITAVPEEADISADEELEKAAEEMEAQVLHEESRNIGQEPGYIAPTSNTVKIPIPDYANYDTVNIQKEIAENIRPYIDALEEEENISKETDGNEVSEGDIVTTDDGVFRVEADTKRIIVAGPNYKLVEVEEEELEKPEEAKETDDAKEASESIPIEQVLYDSNVTIEDLIGTEQEESVKDNSVPETKDIESTLMDIFEDTKTIDINDTASKDINPSDTEAYEIDPLKVDTKEIKVPKEAIDEVDNEQSKSVSEPSTTKESAAKLEEEAAVTVEDDEEPEDIAEDGEASEKQEDMDGVDSLLGELSAIVEASVTAEEEDTKEIPQIKVDETEEEEEEPPYEEKLEEHEDVSVTKEIDAAIVASISKVSDGKFEEMSPIFESKLIDEDDQADYSDRYKEVFAECFGRYTNLKGMEKQVLDTITNIQMNKEDTTSKNGNLVISGNESINKTDLAISFVRALNRLFPEKKRRIAKTTAESLNRRGIKPALEKLMGSALVIEDAASLSKERIEELISIMSENTDGMIVVLIDTEGRILKFLGTNNKFSMYFDNLIEIRKYNVNELIDMAKKYAESKNCVIKDKALLKLYLIVDKLNTGEDSSDIAMTYKVIDTAIKNSQKRSEKSIFAKLRKNNDENRTIVLKESDIPEEIINEKQEEDEDE